MTMKNRLYNVPGLALLSLPTTKKDRRNQRHRHVLDLGETTASQLIGTAEIVPQYPMLFCGSQGKALPLLSQLLRISGMPFVFMGTTHDLEDSCIQMLEPDWHTCQPEKCLNDGSGILELETMITDTYLSLKNCIPHWKNHFLILNLGNGFQIDASLLNTLNGLGLYILLSDSLNRSVKNNSENDKLTVAELLSQMDYVLVSSAGASVRELAEKLPVYQHEKPSNQINLSFHDRQYDCAPHPRNGKGITFGKTKTLETRYIFEPDEIIHLQQEGKRIVYNARTGRVWVARLK